MILRLGKLGPVSSQDQHQQARSCQQQGSGNNNGYSTRIASKRGQVRRHDSEHGPDHCGRSRLADGKVP